MSTTRQLDEAAAPDRGLHHRFGRRIVGQANIPYRIRVRQQIIGGGFGLFLDCVSDHFPTARRGEGLRMLLAQIVAMWFGLVGERTEDRCGVAVGVGECRGSRTLAPCS